MNKIFYILIICSPLLISCISKKSTNNEGNHSGSVIEPDGFKVISLYNSLIKNQNLEKDLKWDRCSFYEIIKKENNFWELNVDSLTLDSLNKLDVNHPSKFDLKYDNNEISIQAVAQNLNSPLLIISVKTFNNDSSDYLKIDVVFSTQFEKQSNRAIYKKDNVGWSLVKTLDKTISNDSTNVCKLYNDLIKNVDLNKILEWNYEKFPTLKNNQGIWQFESDSLQYVFDLDSKNEYQFHVMDDYFIIEMPKSKNRNSSIEIRVNKFSENGISYLQVYAIGGENRYKSFADFIKKSGSWVMK